MRVGWAEGRAARDRATLEYVLEYDQDNTPVSLECTSPEERERRRENEEEEGRRLLQAIGCM